MNARKNKKRSSQSQRQGDEEWRRGPSGKFRVYMSFARETDLGLATEIRDQLEKKGIDVLDFDRCQQWYSGAADVGQLYRLIGETDAFVFLHTESSLKGGDTRRLRQECQFAMHHANNAYYEDSDRQKLYPLVRLVFDDFQPEEIPAEFISFRPVDYRGPNAFELSFDRLIHALRPEDPPTQAERQAYVFQEALESNPRREIYTHALREEFKNAFTRHVGPLADRIKRLEELTRAQDNLMTPEIISVKEADAFDDIWVASHSLHNDLYSEGIPESIANNLRKGIRYVYFVPNTPLIRDKIEQFKVRFSRYCKLTERPNLEEDTRDGRGPNTRRGRFAFYYLDAGVFMPFDELVIYDGENPTHRWGYIQMRYDLAARGANEDGLVMKVPDKTLNTIVSYLLRYKEKHAPTLSCPPATEN